VKGGEDAGLAAKQLRHSGAAAAQPCRLRSRQRKGLQRASRHGSGASPLTALIVAVLLLNPNLRPWLQVAEPELTTQS
jgi:hypothetical protein